MWRTISRREGALTTFSQGLAGDFDLQHRLGEHFRQSGVFGFKLLQVLGIRHAYPAKFAAPEIVTGLRKAVPTAQLLDRKSGLGFAQKANDLFFSETLLYVQSPGYWDWTLTLGTTQIGGDVVITQY